MRPPSVTTMICTLWLGQLFMISRKRPRELNPSKYMPSGCLRAQHACLCSFSALSLADTRLTFQDNYCTGNSLQRSWSNTRVLKL